MYKNKLDKLPEELSRKGQAVGEAVRVALLDFCGQNAEFAQAVEQGGSLADCIESTVQDAGASISDIEVYKRAVQFYFAGAEIHMSMTLDLGDGGFAGDPEPQTERAVELNLDSLLDF